MNERFIIETQKTTKTIKDFVFFKRRVQTPHATFHLTVIGCGLLAMGFSNYPQDAQAGLPLFLLGGFTLMFAVFRHHLTIAKFKKSDQAYLDNWKLKYTFNDRGMCVYRNGERFETIGSYQKISSFYSDETNFYLGINNEEMYVLPKCDFTEGNPDDFLPYIEQKGKVRCEFTPARLFSQIKWRLSQLRN